MEASVIQLPVGQMMNFAYLIGVKGGGVCAVVDPGWDINSIAAEAKAQGWKIEKILLTHAHFDHANGARDLSKDTGAPVYVHDEEIDEIPRDVKTVATSDGTVTDIGGLKIKCIHTPGHTRGSQCFLANGSLFTGDTLFVDGCGRVDLPGSDPKQMLESLKRLSHLDSQTTVYPGHDYGPNPASTIGEQIKTNPYLTADSEAMLI